MNNEKKPVRIVILDDNVEGPAKVITIPKDQWDSGNVINVKEHKEPGKVSHAAKETVETVANTGKAAVTGARKLFGGFASLIVNTGKTVSKATHDAAAEYDQRREAKEQKKKLTKAVEEQVESVMKNKSEPDC